MLDPIRQAENLLTSIVHGAQLINQGQDEEGVAEMMAGLMALTPLLESPPGPSPEETAGKNFDEARAEAFERAGMTDPEDVTFSKVDPETGTVVEFKGPDGAKVAYDPPHASPGEGHDMAHVGWQTAGKRGAGGAERGNITYDGPQHPSRSPVKGRGSLLGE
jgi:hypothetical protein